jgi:hypothetical protein
MHIVDDDYGKVLDLQTANRFRAKIFVRQESDKSCAREIHERLSLGLVMQTDQPNIL